VKEELNLSWSEIAKGEQVSTDETGLIFHRPRLTDLLRHRVESRHEESPPLS